MTPSEVNAQIKGYEQQLKLRGEEANVYAWLIGAYVRIAVASVLDSGIDYPEQPYGAEQESVAEPWQAAKMRMSGFAAKVERSIGAKKE